MDTLTQHLRIVAANNHLYLKGGCERVMFDEIDWLRSRGHSVALFGQKHPQAESLPNDHLFPPATDFAVLSESSPMERARAALRIIYNRGAAASFLRFCGDTHPDVVHCHNIYGGLTTAILDACRSLGLPAVLTLHDYKLACPSYTMTNRGLPCSRCSGGRFYHCLFSRCHKDSIASSTVYTIESYFNLILRKYFRASFLIAPSRFLLERMVSSGIPRQRLRWIPNGIDPLRFRPVYSDRGYALYAGRLSHEKGVTTLLRAACDTSMPLRILGDGPERAALEQWALDRNLRHVSFEGQQPPAVVRDAIEGAAFVVVPSEWYENASMSVLEAMAAGKPVIASRIGGLPEQVEDERTGLLFDHGNAGSLRTSIQVLQNDPERRRSMGAAARRVVEERFSLELHCRRVTAVYGEALRESGTYKNLGAGMEFEPQYGGAIR